MSLKVNLLSIKSSVVTAILLVFGVASPAVIVQAANPTVPNEIAAKAQRERIIVFLFLNFFIFKNPFSYKNYSAELVETVAVIVRPFSNEASIADNSSKT